MNEFPVRCGSCNNIIGVGKQTDADVMTFEATMDSHKHAPDCPVLRSINAITGYFAGGYSIHEPEE